MVLVKFHNMNRKKKFLMSPLNSNSKFFHFTTSQNNITITVQKGSAFFSSFFNLCTVYLKKMFVLSFFFFFHMLCSTMFKFLFFLFFFFLHSHCPVAFFLLVFLFSFFFHFFFIINCSFKVSFFFQPYIYLSVFTLTR